MGLAMAGLGAAAGGLRWVLEQLRPVVAALPEDMRSGFNSCNYSLELLVCVVILGLFTVLLFIWRGIRSARSRLYEVKERKLALELSLQYKEKCHLIDKVILAQEEYKALEASLKEANFDKESTESQILKATHENLESSKSKLEDEILFLEKELEEERAKHSEQDDLMADTLKEKQSLDDELNALKSQIAEGKTTLRRFEINKERLVGTTKDALNETAELEESHKQLLQEAEVMKEKVNELNKQKVKCEESKIQAEQVLNDKDNRIKSLVESLLKMAGVWSAVFGGDVADDGNLDWEVKSDLENDAHLDNQPKGALKKLIDAVKLNASLKALEGERNQIYTQLSEVDKTTEDLTERKRSLESEQTSLPSEITELENEKEKLQLKLQVMTELYQENEMKLHRKLPIEENYRLEQEKKLSKVKEKISYASEELKFCKQRAKDLEEELERTIHFYQGQLMAYEKEAHDNWLVAWTCERNLNGLRKENAYNRQKLIEAELELERLEKDPYALDVPNTEFGRGPRGPDNLLYHHMNTERGESSWDRLPGAPRAPSDKSLSPPWEQDQRMMAPPPDGPVSSKMKPTRKEHKDQPGSSNVPGCSGDGFVPPPGPPVPPVDPRSQLMERACPFSPPSAGKMYGGPPGCYSPPNDFPGPSHLPFPGRNVYPPRGFPPYLPPRAGFFPRHPHDENRGVLPPEVIPPSKEPAAELDGPVSSKMKPTRKEHKDQPGSSNVPGCSGDGFVPPPGPPVPPVDPRSQLMERACPFSPPSAGKMYGGPPGCYSPPNDFPGPSHLPFPGRNVYPPRGFPPYLPPRAGFFPRHPHDENRGVLPPEVIPPSKEPAAELDGPVSSKMKPTRKEHKDQPGSSNVPGCSGDGFVPPPGPPVPPVDPRSQLMERACPFSPPSAGKMYGGPPGCYSPPNDFPGPSHLPFPGRNVYPPRGFPPYLPPRAGFFPRHPHDENRGVLPPEVIPPSKEPAAELDGPVSSKMKPTRKEHKDQPGSSNVPGCSGDGFVPPPGPPVPPVDPRSQLMERACPFSPPSAGKMYGGPPGCYSPPNDFPGPSHLPFPGRNVYPPRGFPPYLPPRAGFFPRHPHDENRGVLPPEVIPPSKEPEEELEKPKRRRVSFSSHIEFI